MAAQTRLKIALRAIVIAAVVCVATSIESTLFAQTRAVIEVSATVVAPPTPTSVTRTVTTDVSLSSAQTYGESYGSSGTTTQTATAKDLAAKRAMRQSVVVTVEYAAN